MTTLDVIEILVRIAWVAGAVAFVIGLVRMNSPATARNGNLVSAGGMVLAVGATAVLIGSRELLAPESFGIRASSWALIIGGIIIGGGLGLYTARVVKMTAMPQLVSLFNAVGGGAAALIGFDDYIGLAGVGEVRLDQHIFIVLDIIIGSITFTGSLIASGKLQGLIPGKPIIIMNYPGETAVIKGSDVVTGWVRHSGNIWKKTGWPYNSQQVFMNFDAGNTKSLQQIGMPSRFYTSWEYPSPTGSGLREFRIRDRRPR